ncbi:MAG: endonuclease III [Anaerolineales bacterium]|jgi:endonuclease-3
MGSSEELALEVHQRLMKAHGRPSRGNRAKPLDVLISTILSQNTNDINRDRAFLSLRERFPTWELVRDAQPEKVIEAIRMAGLANRKGPRIQQVLREITKERGDLDLGFMKSYEPDEARRWLLRFHGVGPKTAAIVMLFALNMPAFPVDTHVYRLTGRLGLRDEKISAEKAHDQLAQLFPIDTYYDVHLNLIRHGRKVCHARRPRCEICILNDLCVYYQSLQQQDKINENVG